MSGITHEQRRLQELVQRLDARLHSTLVISEVILENVSLHDCVPGPFLDGYREGTGDPLLSRSNYENYLRLVEMVGLLRGR